MQIESRFIQNLRRFHRALWIAAPIAALSALVAFLWMDGARLLVSTDSAARLISGKFSLIDHDGRVVTEADFKGLWRLMIFGYTGCPDVSPTMLNEVAEIMDRLGSDAKKIVPLFVSIDPERDKPAVLKEYVSAFHPRIIGLSGSGEQIKDAAKAFRVYYGITRVAGNAQDYQMDHSAIVFLMDTGGRFAMAFSHSTDIENIVTDIRQRL